MFSNLQTLALSLGSAALAGGLVYLFWCRSFHQRLHQAARIARGEDSLPPAEILSPLGQMVDEISSPQNRAHEKTVRDLRHALDEHAIVAITDPSGKITYVNDKFCEISGFNRDELIGQNHRLINSGTHSQDFFRQMWQTIGSGKTWHGEICNRAKDGRLYWVATTIVPFLTEDRKPLQYVSIRTDITSRIEAEKHQERLAIELQLKNKELETIIYAASHDLRSPLVNVQGFASVIEEELPKIQSWIQDSKAVAASDEVLAAEIASAAEEMSTAVTFITAGATKIDALLKGLLAISRLGRAPIELHVVNVQQLVKDCLDAMQFQLEGVGGAADISELPTCMGDESLLGQIFSNLCDNAIRYRHPERPLRLDISGHREGSYAIYRVCDNGIGIDPQHREVIFDLFHRLNPSIGDGHGLGLGIVRRALERMKGNITVENSPTGGTAFEFKIPAA